ncbi:hypothetical protein SDC9_177131 [bioreactor metagenome]|uniref:Uncharacterized protein n=1 Tax=bioreactor metagenome TaxID=1076179 RepID=A0A645GS38_9ZZZZ
MVAARRIGYIGKSIPAGIGVHDALAEIRLIELAVPPEIELRILRPIPAPEQLLCPVPVQIGLIGEGSRLGQQAQLSTFVKIIVSACVIDIAGISVLIGFEIFLGLVMDYKTVVSQNVGKRLYEITGFIGCGVHIPMDLLNAVKIRAVGRKPGVCRPYLAGGVPIEKHTVFARNNAARQRLCPILKRYALRIHRLRLIRR